MGKLDVHTSSERMDWETPPGFFDALHGALGFTLDVCAHADNTKLSRFYDEAADGLAQSWDGRCWMNPPYGRAIKHWMTKAVQETRDNPRCEFVVCLVPARVDTLWWHDNVMSHASCVFLVRGRLTFVGAPASAPFPVAVVVFESGKTGPPRFQAMDKHGKGLQ